ncbi:MAG: flagellar biosynthetic protein FliQ [Acidobacteria bacterium]|nr:flagellar biosynthetic protein FliQ [Acidobacteriota bacterium]
MSAQEVVDLLRQVFWTTFWLSLPLLALGFLAGVAISLVQIVTSIQDSSFGAVPRLAAFLGGLLLFLPWMLSRILSYTANLLGDFGRYAR